MMARTIKTPEKMIAYLAKRIRALESINACYRMGRSPVSVYLDDASDTFGWEIALSKYKELINK